MTRHLIIAGWVTMFLVTAGIASVWPLSLWAISLALFGVPHVLVELNWVEARYGVTVPRASYAVALVALVGVVLVRIIGSELGFSPDACTAMELGLAVVLMISVLPPVFRRSPKSGLAGVGLCALLFTGVVTDPINTLVVFAFLHNLTPLGLIWDRLRDPTVRGRRNLWPWAVAAIGVFLLLPMLVFFDWFPALMRDLTGESLSRERGVAYGWLGADRYDGVGSFVPEWVAGDLKWRLFRAAAFLQIVHYTAVLWFLPRLGPRESAGSGRRLGGFLLPVAVGLVLSGLFTWGFFQVDGGFRETKAAYGVLAAVHAWVELPVLLLALAGASLAPRRLGSAPTPG